MNPGRAAILAVALLTVIYTLSQVGFQGVLSPAKLNEADANGTALVAVAQVLGPWSQRWSLIGIVIAGLVLLVCARFVLRSSFFSLPRETEKVKGHRKIGPR